MVIVIETWYLKPALAANARAIMQEMDDAVGPPAHVHPGWSGHARFFQDAARPTEVLMLYKWRSRALHEDLCATEEPTLAEFYETYCTRPRQIAYYTELPVDVHADDDDHTHPASAANGEGA
jgi:hypothetical protein